MRINKLTLREIHLELLEPFQTSFHSLKHRRILLVEADVDGVIGWGEATLGEDPLYSYETVETGWHIIRDFIWPMLRGRELKSAADVAAAWEKALSAGRVREARVIVEGEIAFDFEITQLTVRAADGTHFCEPIGHVQKDGDYVESWQPQPMSESARASPVASFGHSPKRLPR